MFKPGWCSGRLRIEIREIARREKRAADEKIRAGDPGEGGFTY
jgi:hypothetical protein